MIHELLTPLPELIHHSARIRVNLPFPSWVETKNMGINVHQTESLMNLGGLHHVRFIGDVDGEQTSTIPLSVGVNSDGSQSAGMGRIVESVQIQSYKNDQQSREQSVLRNYDWTSTTIKVNLKEIKKNIDERNGNLKTAETWTPYLDTALRQGIRQAGCEHLLTRFTPFQKFFNFWLHIQTNLLMACHLSFFDIIAGNKPQFFDGGSLLFFTALNFLSISIIMKKTIGIENVNGSGYRVSLFPGFEIDRAAALQLISRTRTLIKPIQEHVVYTKPEEK